MSTDPASPLATLARIVALLPQPRREVAKALGVTAPRLSAWMARAAGKGLKARDSGNWDPTKEQIATARRMLEAHGLEVDEERARYSV